MLSPIEFGIKLAHALKVAAGPEAPITFPQVKPNVPNVTRPAKPFHPPAVPAPQPKPQVPNITKPATPAPIPAAPQEPPPQLNNFSWLRQMERESPSLMPMQHDGRIEGDPTGFEAGTSTEPYHVNAWQLQNQIREKDTPFWTNTRKQYERANRLIQPRQTRPSVG